MMIGKSSEESNDCVKLPNCIYKIPQIQNHQIHSIHMIWRLPGNTLTNQNIKEKYDNLNDIDKEKDNQ